MESIIDKLKKIDGYKNTFDTWSLEEHKQLLNIYLTICKKESHLLDLTYRYHGTDGFEDIFRDYDERYLEEKVEGVKMALDEIKNIENGYKNVYDDTEHDESNDTE